MALKTTKIVKTLVVENAKIEHYKKFVMPPDNEKVKRMRGEFPIAHIKEEGEKIQYTMPEAHLVKIIANDPTSNVPEGATKLEDVKHIGRYSNWLVVQYFRLIPKDFMGEEDPRYRDVREAVALFVEDLYKVKDDLIKFHRFNKRVQEDKRDIGKVKNPDELYMLTKDIQVDKDALTMTKAEVKEKKKKEGAEYVYEDDRWEILIPKTPEASHEIAGPPLTRWCTASSSASSYHTSYSKNGPLFILRDKTHIISSGKGAGEPKPMYQFHFPSGQFMDEHDRQIQLIDFLKEKKNAGLKEFFRPQFEQAFNKTEFNVEDRTFKNYIALYGANEDTKKLILNIFKNKVSSKDDISTTESDRDLGGFMELLGYEEFFARILEYAKRTITVMEITFTKYDGQGIDIPDTIAEFKNLENIVLSGFVRTLPESICTLKNLELISVAQSKNVHSLPECIGMNPALNVLNVTNTPVLENLPQSVLNRDGMEEVLIVFN